MPAAIVLSAILDVAAASSVLPPLELGSETEATDPLPRPCRYTGNFKQERYVAELENPLTSTGSFLFSCDKGLIWDVRKPITDTRIYSTESLNFRIRKSNRVTQLQSIVESSTAQLLLNFLSGDIAALAKDFNLTNDDNIPGKIILLPKKKSVRRRLTQLIVQQTNDTVLITIQVPDSGDIVISIDNIAIIKQSNLSACRTFSQTPKTHCDVFIRPADFTAANTDPTR